MKQLVLEFATPRAGELGALLSQTGIRKNKELGLGVVNPRLEEIETVEAIVSRVEEALKDLNPGQIFLNPDCGFGTFSGRPMSSEAIAVEKLDRIAQAAQVLRKRHG